MRLLVESEQPELLGSQGDGGEVVEEGELGPDAGEGGGEEDGEHGHLYQVQEAGACHLGRVRGHQLDQDHVVGVVQTEDGKQ